MKPLLLLSAIALLGARTDHTSSVQSRVLASEPGDRVLFVVGDNAQSLHVSRDGIAGDAIELRRSPGRLSGSVGSEAVDLALEAPWISGTIGDHRVSLDVVRSGNGLSVAGRFGARDIALHVRPERIDGAVGPCTYHLALKRNEYQGEIGCGAEPEQVRLRIPVALVARSDVELAAMLTAVLAR